MLNDGGAARSPMGQIHGSVTKQSLQLVEMMSALAKRRAATPSLAAPGPHAYIPTSPLI